jgi:hypothetical protein
LEKLFSKVIVEVEKDKEIEKEMAFGQILKQTMNSFL